MAANCLPVARYRPIEVLRCSFYPNQLWGVDMEEYDVMVAATLAAGLIGAFPDLLHTEGGNKAREAVKLYFDCLDAIELERSERRLKA